MSHHLADHRVSSQGGRTRHFLRIARIGKSGSVWRGLWQRPATRSQGNRRVVEYLRIEKGHEA